jgi:predicted permease
VRELWRRMNAFLRRRSLDRDLEEELRFHLDMKAPEIGDRAAAGRALGNPLLLRERAREAWGWRWLDEVLWDVRFALRTFRKSPGFTATAVLSLAVGIGGATGLFSVVYAVLLNPFPYVDADRIVTLGLIDKGTRRGLFLNARQLVDLQQSDVLAGVIATDIWPMTLTGRDLPEAVNTQYLSANGLTVLGIPPLLGRVFTEADGPPGEQPQRVVVLMYRFWQSHFGGRADAVGQTLQLNHETYTVIGVLPRRYFPTGLDIIVPIHLTFDPNFAWAVQARLKPGLSAGATDAQLQPLFEQFARETPHRFPQDVRAQVRSQVDGLRGADFVPTLLLIFAAALLLLLLACANVSILLLARGASREHEFAVRSAIGATRRRLLSQLLIESLLLALSSAALGVAAGYWGIPAMLRLLPPNSLPAGNLVDVPVSVPVLAFSVGLAMLSALLAGLSPAFSFSRLRVTPLMHGSARTTGGGAEGRRVHHLLLAGQLALTVLLLAGTGAAIRALIGLYQTPLGYDPHNLIVALVNLPENSHTVWADRAAFYEHLREALTRTPQVESVALSTFSGVPPRSGGRSPIEIPGRDMAQSDAPVLQRIGPQYFATVKIPVVQGRVWSESENARAAHVAVVNETMARRLWPDQPAVGQRLRIPEYVKSTSQFTLAAPGSDGWFDIVGIVGDTPNVGLHEPTAPSIYVPYTLMLSDSLTVIARTTRNPLAMTRSIRETVRAVDANQPVNNIRTADDALAAAGWARERFVTLLLLGFAVCALLLAVVGLYSVVSYSVSRRLKEFGIRMALGAGHARIVRLALRSAILAVGVGLLAGLALSLVSNTVLARWSIGNLSDPVVLVAISLVLLGVTLAAAAIPASRAASIQPADALRID